MPYNTINESISEILKDFSNFNAKGIIEKLYSLGQIATKTVEENKKDILSLKNEQCQRVIKDFAIKDQDQDQDQDLDQKITLKQILSLYDTYLCWSGNLFKNKNDYKHLKDKNEILMNKRRFVHRGLSTIACIFLLKNENKFKENKIFDFEKLKLQDLFSSLNEVKNHLQVLDKSSVTKLFNDEDEVNRQKFLREIKEEIKKFSQLSKTKEYAIKGFSTVLSLIVALTAGLATGGAIYLLLISLGCFVGIGIGGGVLTFLVGFWSNYSFFSRTVPEFFRMVAKDQLTQYIDTDNKRTRMKWFKQCLLGFAFILSLSVGMVSAALLVGSIMSLSALVFPFLGPTASLILSGVLGLFYGVALTITMFYAFVNVLKNPTLSSAESQNSRWRQISGYFVKGILTGLVLFGIGFGCYVSIPALAMFLSAALPSVPFSLITNICSGFAVVSFIGQIPFAMLSVNKFCNAIANWDKQKQPNNYFFTLVNYFALTVNALGNAALVFIPGRINSMIAAIGSWLYSFLGNADFSIGKEALTIEIPSNAVLVQENQENQENQNNETVRVKGHTFFIKSSIANDNINNNINEKVEYDHSVISTSRA